MTLAWTLNERVRPARPGDAKAVLRILYESLREHGFPVTERDTAEQLRSFGAGEPRVDELVGLSNHRLAGFLVLVATDRPGRGELSKFFVSRSSRRRGLGTLLMDQALVVAARRGYDELFLETEDAFKEARRYYEHHGWLPAERTAAGKPTYVRRLSR